MSILVTGGTGYIGSHTVVELLEAGYDVVIADNLSNSKITVLDRIEKITGKRPAFYQIDLCDEVALDHLFAENQKIEAVIHFAGLKAVGESVSIPLSYYHNNLLSTLNLCRSMEKHNVTRLVFSSSATVYGLPHALPITEDFPLSATNPYGQTKLMIEYILKDWCVANHNASVSILRYFNPIGAHETGLIGEDPRGIPNNLLPYVAQVAAGKLTVLSVYGNDYDTHDGTGVRDYIHVVDLAKAHLCALTRTTQMTGAECINVGTGNGYSVLEILHAFEKAWGNSIPYRITERRPGDIAACYADATKAKDLLGWEAEYDIERMCEDIVRWQRNNPDGYPDA